MPRGIGVFNRKNGEFNGAEVWQDDLQKPEKIVALRHDVHDQDLADGIAECLPKDGSEPMLGVFDAGDFIISNVGNPTLSNHAANLRQTITNATWSGGSEQLTLIRGAGNIVVTIPVGGGTTTPLTGMQRQIAGAGISFGGGTEMGTSNPEDTISLSNTGVSPASYSNPNITIDAQGRITSATNGSSVATNLSIPPASHSVLTLDIASSTGTDVTIPQATELKSGLMTGGNISLLIEYGDRLDELESGGAMQPPLGIYGIRDAGIIDLIPSVTGWIQPSANFTGDALNVWTSVRDEFGKGTIDFLALRLLNIGIDNITLGVRLKIDGNVVWQDSSFYPSMVIGSNPQNSDVVFIGAVDGVDDGGAPSQIAFNTSWSIEMRANSNASNSVEVYAKYYSDEPFVE